MEAEPDGSAVAQPVVRLFPGTRLMLAATDTEHAPWHIVRSDDKKRARLNCIANLLGSSPTRRCSARR